jgi:hypothetical protein
VNFNQYLGKYVCGNLSEMDYPKLGVAGIIEGLESKYLGILAGMYRTDEISELRKYLKLSIEELDLSLPTKRDAAILYSSAILDEILNEKKDIIEGIHEIKSCALNTFDFNQDDIIGFESVHGLFVSYYEYKSSTLKIKTKRKLMDEVKLELLSELKIWKQKLQNGV